VGEVIVVLFLGPSQRCNAIIELLSHSEDVQERVHVDEINPFHVVPPLLLACHISNEPYCRSGIPGNPRR
jgi:hypothetical protein